MLLICVNFLTEQIQDLFSKIFSVISLVGQKVILTFNNETSNGTINNPQFTRI
ncbi:MAG: hypothetical protein CM15mV37_0970 [uncultured marine virus]|nr:MAG: hypothetical protein CM15mV37_0970 [uncultured marine virus]